VLDGLYVGAVVAHLAAWPRTRPWLPWLTECEGMSGRLMPAYNLVLLGSVVAGVGGLVEARRPWAAVVPLVVAAVMVPEQHREHARLVAQARRRPGWWNRRLAG
jgi:hypothetical protein